MRISNFITTVDTHTAGEPTRMVTSGLRIPGVTLLDKLNYLKERKDFLRKALMGEPRGHRGMFGVYLTEPTHPKADYGIIFMDNDGYYNMCGHGTIGLCTALAELSMVEVKEPITLITLESPAGLVEATVHLKDGVVQGVSFRNVPSFLYGMDIPIDLPEIGKKIKVDISYGGNFFAIAKAEDLGLQVVPDQAEKLVQAGMAIRKGINAKMKVQHPVADHIRSVHIVTIYSSPSNPTHTYRNIHVFGKGQFDRSPGGTGTSAMMAMYYGKGQLQAGGEVISEGVMGGIFRGKIVETVKVGKLDGIVPEVKGEAFLTGIHQFIIDPRDPMKHGFHIE
jgi:proline racemase